MLIDYNIAKSARVYRSTYNNYVCVIWHMCPQFPRTYYQCQSTTKPVILIHKCSPLDILAGVAMGLGPVLSINLADLLRGGELSESEL